MHTYAYLSEDSIGFPPVHQADWRGLLAVGGDLSENRLLDAYSSGIFPWYTDNEPILWWSPDPRFVLYPEELKVHKSMRSYFNQRKFEVSYDQAFEQVMRNCGLAPRYGQSGTWITEEMIEAYLALHKSGFAHSVEVWKNEELVGGLYGVSIGKCYFGESMFTKVSNASKFGFISLIRELIKHDFMLIDCQIETKHLASLGARHITRSHFVQTVRESNTKATLKGNWGELLSKGVGKI